MLSELVEDSSKFLENCVAQFYNKWKNFFGFFRVSENFNVFSNFYFKVFG